MKEQVTVTALVCLFTGGVLVSGSAFAAQTPADQGTGAKAPATQTAPAQGAKGAGEAAADATFMRQAANDGMAEVEHGRLAAKNASSADVKQFGQQMVDDHGKANGELKGLASKKSVTLPATMDAKHQAMQDKLAKMTGASFDSAYMAHMVAAHAQAVALFQKEAKGGADPDAKAWAAKTLPTLQEHHKMAQSIHAKLKGGQK